MHYGLVKWLAYKAGFSLGDAELIAAGSESADKSGVLSATGVMKRTGCRSTEASRHTQQHHFASGGFVPSAPKDRKVVPGRYGEKNNGNRWVRQEIVVPAAQLDRRTRLDRFGASLHPLADSWSHQGESDTVWTCPDDRFWGHPAARGGISLDPSAKHNHDADLTYKFPKDSKLPRDATDSARSIYAFMNEFLAKNPQFVDHKSKSWNHLNDDVEKFARASKAYAAKDSSTKQAWFESHTDVWGTYTTYPCFLQSLNLPGHEVAECSPAKGKKIAEAEIPSRGDQPAVDERVPNDVRLLVADFLTAWIVNRNISDAIERFTDPDAIAASLSRPILARIEAAPSQLRERNEVQLQVKALQQESQTPQFWMRAMLGMWFARDHGLVNQWGHGMPNFEAGFKILAGGDFEQLPRFENLVDAIQVPGGASTYLLAPMEPAERGERYLATFAFRHAPRDAIMLTVERISREWKVSGFVWLVD